MRSIRPVTESGASGWNHFARRFTSAQTPAGMSESSSVSMVEWYSGVAAALRVRPGVKEKSDDGHLAMSVRHQPGVRGVRRLRVRRTDRVAMTQVILGAARSRTMNASDSAAVRWRRRRELGKDARIERSTHGALNIPVAAEYRSMAKKKLDTFREHQRRRMPNRPQAPLQWREVSIRAVFHRAST
jgi:hypothetical protein